MLIISLLLKVTIVDPLNKHPKISKIELSKNNEFTFVEIFFPSMSYSFLHHSEKFKTCPWVIITPFGSPVEPGPAASGDNTAATAISEFSQTSDPSGVQPSFGFRHPESFNSDLNGVLSQDRLQSTASRFLSQIGTKFA